MPQRKKNKLPFAMINHVSRVDRPHKAHAVKHVLLNTELFDIRNLPITATAPLGHLLNIRLQLTSTTWVLGLALFPSAQQPELSQLLPQHAGIAMIGVVGDGGGGTQ